MSVQIFLQGKMVGIEEFLLSAASDALLIGRSHWITLLCEVLPRALLAEFGLAKILLGSSGSGQFLVVLPSEARSRADEFLGAAGRQVEELSGGQLSLIWVATENLGDWSVVRKRLNDEMQRKRGAPAAGRVQELFEINPVPQPADAEDYFAHDLGSKLAEASAVGWAPETPGQVRIGEGKHLWRLNAPEEGIPWARHAALGEDGRTPASTAELAARADGKTVFGVLRGDVDNFGIRLRRLQSIEEHVQLSMMYKQFFAGELEVLCSMPEFWRRVSILYSGGDDFAVYGAWDGLILLARELQRLFHRFSEENLRDFPGPEGKTISMALSLAPEVDSSLVSVYQEAGEKLEIAKSASKDCFSLLGRALEWRQLNDAAEMRDTLARMVNEFGCPPQFLNELAGFYRDSTGALAGVEIVRRGKSSHFEKPWRIHRRLNRVLGARDREFQKVRASLTADLIGKGTQVKLRPAGRVALEWARLSTEVENHG